MKKLLSFLAFCLITMTLNAQAPESFKYQSVVRDGTGSVIANQNVSFQISILQTSSTGTSVYTEQHNATTNNFGLVNLEIGTGTVVSGTFSGINWSIDEYFVQIELDATGGSSYQLMGTSQLLSVPYALHAKTAESVSGTINENDPVFAASVANGITTSDTANWNNHTIDTDTQLDSVGISDFGYVAGAHTINTDTQIDSLGIANYGFISSAADGDTTHWKENGNNLYFNSGKVSIGTDTIAESAIMEISSNSKGFLPPRLTTAERDLINNPSDGLFIFNITTNCLNFFTSGFWFESCGENATTPSLTLIDCSALTVTNDIYLNQNLNNVDITIPYTGGNGGVYQNQTLISSNVLGLTADLPAGSLNIGNGNLIYSLSGSALSAGIASFNINLGGQSCIANISVLNDSVSITETGSQCCNQSLSLTASSNAGVSYSWIGPNGYTNSGNSITLDFLTDNMNGWYVVSGFDANSNLFDKDSVLVNISCNGYATFEVINYTCSGGEETWTTKILTSGTTEGWRWTNTCTGPGFTMSVTAGQTFTFRKYGFVQCGAANTPRSCNYALPWGNYDGIIGRQFRQPTCQ